MVALLQGWAKEYNAASKAFKASPHFRNWLLKPQNLESFSCQRHQSESQGIATDFGCESCGNEIHSILYIFYLILHKRSRSYQQSIGKCFEVMTNVSRLLFHQLERPINLDTTMEVILFLIFNLFLLSEIQISLSFLCKNGRGI